MHANPSSPERFAIQFRLSGRPERWFFHLRPTAVSLTIDTFTIYTFDREGRLFSTFQNGENCRRSLSGRFLARFGEGDGDRRSRRRRLLDGKEAGRIVDRLQARLAGLAEAVRGGGVQVDTIEGAEGPGAMAPWVERLRAWDRERLTADAGRFAQVYRPVSILPPDQYMALVLQVTEGCPWNRCAFCDLYRDRAHRVKDETEVETHLHQVRGFLGEGLQLRRAVFLADGNLLSVPGPRLVSLLEQVRSGFPEERFADLYAFCDVFGSRRLRHAELVGLRQAGLRRLYVGLETGADGLRKVLRKPGTAALVVDGVNGLRAAGIQVGAIVLLGPGGREWAAVHEAETAAVLERMQLGEGDFLYFSPLVVSPDMDPVRRTLSIGRTPLSEEEMAEQRHHLEAAISCRERGARVARYDIRDFAY